MLYEVSSSRSDEVNASHDASQSVTVRLAAIPESFTLLAACVRAMLARVPGDVPPDEDVREFLTALDAAFAHTVAMRRVASDEPLEITLTVGDRTFFACLDADWRFALALAGDELTAEANSGYDAGVRGENGLGAGIFLVRRLMDEVEYLPQPGDNRWRLVKALDGELPQVTRSIAATLDLPAGHRYLNLVGECIAAMLGPGVAAADQVQLAAHETCLNIVDHAYAGDPGRLQVALALEAENRRFVVETHDAGTRSFDLAAIPDRFDPWAPAVRSGLISGSALLFASATLVNAGNYLFNLLLGRWLGPAAFADLSLIVTLFLVTSFITAGMQTPAARFSAIFAADHDLQGIADVRRWSAWRAGLLGVVLGLIFALGAPLWSYFFSTASVLPFVIFGIFVPFYLVQGVDRGLLQGRTRFGWLAVTYQTEMWSRLALSVVLVAAGWAVNGAVLAIGLSFAAAWLVARRVAADLPSPRTLAPKVQHELLVFTGPVLVAQLGQILINNSDILIVRRFFPAESAGIYAALALIGRIVFFATWSIVTAMFPIVAQRFHRGQSHRHFLYFALSVVAAGSLVIVAITYFFPEPIVRILFGPAYLSIAPLLWLYALATMFYALANVVINYRLSIGNTGGTYLAIVAGVAQVLLLWFWHDSLQEVVMIQLGLMAALFGVLLVWDMAIYWKNKEHVGVEA
jgi:O-antigen/teichoic acid export membrane protein